MKEPKKIKLTDSPESKKVSLTPLPSINSVYPEVMRDDIYIKTKEHILDDCNNENNSQNNS